MFERQDNIGEIAEECEGKYVDDPRYPEHQKLARNQYSHLVITKFMKWSQDRYDNDNGTEITIEEKREVESFIAEYFDVDYEALVSEREQIEMDDLLAQVEVIEG